MSIAVLGTFIMGLSENGLGGNTVVMAIGSICVGIGIGIEVGKVVA